MSNPPIPPITASGPPTPSTQGQAQSLLQLPANTTPLQTGQIIDVIFLRQDRTQLPFIQLTNNAASLNITSTQTSLSSNLSAPNNGLSSPTNSLTSNLTASTSGTPTSPTSSTQLTQIPIQHRLPIAAQSTLTLEILRFTPPTQNNPLEFEARIQSINQQPITLTAPQAQQSFDIIRAVPGLTLPTTNITTDETQTSSSAIRLSTPPGIPTVQATLISPSRTIAEQLPTLNTTLPITSGQRFTLALELPTVQPSINNTANIPAPTPNITTVGTSQSNIPPTSQSPGAVSPQGPSLGAPSSTTQRSTTQNQTLPPPHNPITTNATSSPSDRITPNAVTTTTNTPPTTSQPPASSPTVQNQTLPPTQHPTTTNAITSFSATVIGTDQAGDSLLSTPIGTLRIASSNLTLPPQSTLNLHLLSIDPNTEEISPPTVTPARAGPLTTESQKTIYSQAFESIDTVRSSDPSPLRDLLPNVHNGHNAPNENKKAFAAKLLWFISARFSDDLNADSLPTRTERWLAQQPPATVRNFTALEHQFAQAHQQFTEANNNGWNQLVIPFLQQEKLHFLDYHSRRYHNEQDEQMATHFVIEAELSSLGNIQLDGTITQSTNGTSTPLHFDLTFRSHSPLSEEMKHDIYSIFETAQAVSGFSGYLHYDVQEQFPDYNTQPTSISGQDRDITI